jgi:hypothetical protein
MGEVGTPPGLFNEGVAVAHHGASAIRARFREAYGAEVDGMWEGWLDGL